MKTEFIVRTSAAQMPGSCWGVYRRIGLMEVEKGVEPKMIASRARGVIRIVRTWERLNVGKTEHCAYRVALAHAEEIAARLNAQNPNRQEVG